MSVTAYRDRFPRAQLAHVPTPLEAMPNLSRKLGGPNIFIKRDDCTGLAMGGNKARQLEYYLGEAIAQNADTLIITGAVQSNFVRQAAAAARKYGMDIHIQLEERVSGKDDVYRRSGNVLLDKVLGATIHKFPMGEDEAAADAALEAIADIIRARGGRPYVVHLGLDHEPLGALGYVDAALEVLAQLKDQGISMDGVFLSSGSAATHVGFLAGLRLGGSDIKVYGICVRRDGEQQHARMTHRAAEISKMIELETPLTDADIIVDDVWLGGGYGQLTPQAEEAIRMTAHYEGILLDPVYTAKTMAGLIGHVRDGEFKADQNILFFHTGGTPALFGYSQFLL